MARECSVRLGINWILLLYLHCYTSQYYDSTFASLKEQQKFEETLFNKTHRANGKCRMNTVAIISDVLTAEIVMLEGTTCVYRSNVDLYFYVVGSQIENEVVIDNPNHC